MYRPLLLRGNFTYLQVRFSLSSTSAFSRADTITDSEYFYQLIVDLLDDPEEAEEVDDLLKWWNQLVFCIILVTPRPVLTHSAIDRP